jgi:hypothetical protein
MENWPLFLSLPLPGLVYLAISSRACRFLTAWIRSLYFDQRMTEMAYFITCTKSTNTTFANLFVSNIVCLHGLPTASIVSDRSSIFTSNFWSTLAILKIDPANRPPSILKLTVKPNARIKRSKRTFGSLSTKIKATGLISFLSPNSLTTSTTNLLECPRFSPTTVYILVFFPNPPPPKFPLPTNSPFIFVMSTNALSKTSNALKTSKPVITT